MGRRQDVEYTLLTLMIGAPAVIRGDGITVARVEAYYLPKHGAQPLLLETPGDIGELIDGLLHEPITHSIAALYCLERPFTPAGAPDHELYVAVERDLRGGALSFMDATGNWASLGAPNGRVDVRYYLTCNEREFPGCDHRICAGARTP